jgi:protein CpxP
MIMTHARYLLVLVLLLSGTAFAGAHTSSPGGGHGSGHGPGGMGMSMMPKMAEKLGLSEAQKQDMAALVEMYQPRFKAIAARGKADREALLAMAPDDPAYGELTASVSQEAGLAAAEVVTLMSELQGNVYALLSTEQQAKYLELRASQKAKMQEHRDRRKECMSKDGAPEGCMGQHKGMHEGMHKRHHKNCEGEECPHHPPAAEDDAS